MLNRNSDIPAAPVSSIADFWPRGGGAIGTAFGTTALVAAVGGFVLSLFVFFPGYLTRDASYVHSYVLSGYLGDWQSPLMTLVSRLIDPISPGSGSMFLLIAALYWLGFAMTALAVARRFGGWAVAV